MNREYEEHRGKPPYLGWKLTEMLFTQCLSLVLVKPCKRQRRHEPAAACSCMAEKWPVIVSSRQR